MNGEALSLRLRSVVIGGLVMAGASAPAQASSGEDCRVFQQWWKATTQGFQDYRGEALPARVSNALSGVIDELSVDSAYYSTAAMPGAAVCYTQYGDRPIDYDHHRVGCSWRIQGPFQGTVAQARTMASVASECTGVRIAEDWVEAPAGEAASAGFSYTEERAPTGNGLEGAGFRRHMELYLQSERPAGSPGQHTWLHFFVTREYLKNPFTELCMIQGNCRPFEPQVGG